MKKHVLICGLSQELHDALYRQDRRLDFSSFSSSCDDEVIAHVVRLRPDALIIDERLTVLRRLRALGVDVPSILVGAASVDTAITAARLGAAACLGAAASAAEIGAALAELLPHRRVGDLRLAVRGSGGYERLIGASPAMLRVFETLRCLETVATPTVLVTGESGTGKDLVAQAIHARGPRRARPYLTIDCAAMPATLIENELFGHERGAFTDARQSKRGLFEEASGGVVFLDEIGEMTLVTQAKLLRALESRRVRRIGGVSDVVLDVALIAATNRDLRKEVRAGRFREDLYFRLNVVPIALPPLRRRREDIEPVTLALVAQLARALHRPAVGVTCELMTALVEHSWPGNVRELRNVVERMLVLKSSEGALAIDDLPAAALATQTTPRDGFELPAGGVVLSAVESSLIEQALRRTHGNQTQAAKLLGISRYTLRHRGQRADREQEQKQQAEPARPSAP